MPQIKGFLRYVFAARCSTARYGSSVVWMLYSSATQLYLYLHRNIGAVVLVCCFRYVCASQFQCIKKKNTQNQQQHVAFVERTHWHRSPVFAWKTSFVCLCGCEFTHWANDLLASSVAWNIIALSVAHIPNRCVYAPTERNGIECGRFCVRRDKNVLMEAWFVCMFSAYTAFLLVLVAPHTCKLRRKLTRSNNNQPKKQQKLVWKRVQPTKRIRLIHSKRYRR